MKPLKISIIGAGNVGTRLAMAFHARGHQIGQVCSRRPAEAKKLASKVHARAVESLSEVDDTSDLYLLCIPDQSIRELGSQLQVGHKLLCHTSGSTEMEILKPLSNNHGVFYPLQTFSSRKSLNFKRIPICLEANTEENEAILFQLGRQLSGDVRLVDTPSRMIIHLAAVIAGNFSNYMYVMAEEILQEHGFSFSILHPLIEETSKKAMKISPFQAQTGPALRNDTEVIQKHLHMLGGKPRFQEIYRILTDQIKTDFNHPS